MLRRLKFFAAGALISILVLSMGPENRLKDTFYAYIDYFNPDKRVITQLTISDSLVVKSEISEDYLRKFYDGAWVNDSLSDKTSYPQFFVLENKIEEKSVRVSVNFYDREEKKDSLGDLRRFTKSEVVSFEEGINISSRSFKSYYLLFGFFLLVMVPVSLLVRRLIQKRRLEDE